MTNIMKKPTTIIWFLCSVAFALRMAYALLAGDMDSLPRAGSDQSEYELYAWNMASGRGFSGYSAASPDRELPTSFRAPLPSIVYSLVYRVTGRHPAVLKVLNICFDTLNVCLIFLLARQLAGAMVGVLSATMWCIYPMAVFLSGYILSESLAVSLMCIHLLLLIKFQRSKDWMYLICAGLTLGLLMLAKAEFLLYLVLLNIWIAYTYWSQWKQLLRVCVLISLTSALVVLPWTIRNYRIHGTLVPISTGGGETLLQGNNNYVVPGTPVSDPTRYGYNCSSWGLSEYRDMFRGMDEVERDRAAQKEAVRWLLENKQRWPWLIWAKTKRHWTPFMQSTSDAKLRYAMLLSYGPILLLAIPSMLISLVYGFRRRKTLTLLYLIILFSQIKAVLFFGYARYRLLAAPALIVFAAISLVWLLRAVRPWLFKFGGDVATSGSCSLSVPVVRPNSGEWKLSVVMPVYNENATISQVVGRVLAAPLPVGVKSELIIVDDGSNDGTKETLRKLSETKQFVYFEHDKNQGKGAALRTGFKHAKGDIILVQDADMEYDPNEYSRLIAPIMNGDSRVVYGSRILGEDENPKGGRMFYFGGRFLSFITNVLYGTSLSDEPTCYKVFDAATLKSLPLKCLRFEFCPEVTAMLAKKGVDILEIPITYNPRGLSEGKKITWRDGVEAIWTLCRLRVNG